MNDKLAKECEETIKNFYDEFSLDVQWRTRVPCEWDILFLNLAHELANRSKDMSTQCGAVLVDTHNVLVSCGFNGPPRELEDDLVPWEERPAKYAYIIHAEENAIGFALEHGAASRVRGSRIYCTHVPCADCTLRCIRYGVKEVVIPDSTPPYPLSSWHKVTPDEIVSTQKFPKLSLRKVTYAKTVSKPS